MEQISNVEVILDNLESNPKCIHGPTILFRRLGKDQEQKFYACSACRDKKDCTFYLRYEDEWTTLKESKWIFRTNDILSQINTIDLSKRLQDVYKLSFKDRAFCHTCNTLVLPSECTSHKSHELQSIISDYQLSHPSELMKPLESSKKEAQYLFSSKSVGDIVKMLQSAGIQHVICIGSPRIHERICNQHCNEMSSVLLDFDHRYHQFSDDSKFVWFNVFNCHWFLGEKGKTTVLQFMKEAPAESMAIVTDPPFGGRVEPLLRTFQCLDEMHKLIHPARNGPISLMWVFPYFMEPTLTTNNSKLIMLDYKVEYDNHPLFHQGIKGRKYGSPVRIFTNLAPSKLLLPSEDGYWYCKVCMKWASIENRHCAKCDSCTSKNGSTYVHCDKCKRCVKPSWKHCDACQRCCMQDHKCGKFQPAVCFGCRQPGHKKNECPFRNTSENGYSANRERKQKRKIASLRPKMENTPLICEPESSLPRKVCKFGKKSKQERTELACVKPKQKY